MNCRKKINRASVFILALLLVGCSQPTNSPTYTPPTPIPIPPSLRFVNHPQPVFDVSFEAFENAGCPASEYGFRRCEDDSPLIALGCDEIREPSDLLGALEPAYPIAQCLAESRTASENPDVEWLGVMDDYAYSAEGDYFFRVGGILNQVVRYVIFRDNQFVLIETEDEFRTVFSPVDTTDEALAYVKAVTGLDDYYGLEPNPQYTYFVSDAIEDTHADEVEDGYSVHLYYHQTFGCGPHPTYAVDLLVTPQGHIRQLGTEKTFTNPSEDEICVD